MGRLPLRTVPGPVLRRVSRSPVRSVAALVRARWRRARFVSRVTVAAVLSRATVELSIDPSATFGDGVTVSLQRGSRTTLVIGPKVQIYDGVEFTLRGGSVRLDEGVKVQRLCAFNVGGDLHMAEGSGLGAMTKVHCDERVTIGALSITGDGVTIADSDHVRTPVDVPTHHHTTSAPISIGRNVFMASGCRITAGTTVGDIAVIAANAVVRGEVREGFLAVGNPARAIKHPDTPAVAASEA